MNGAASIGLGVKTEQKLHIEGSLKVPSSMVEVFVEVLNEMLLSQQKHSLL